MNPMPSLSGLGIGRPQPLGAELVRWLTEETDALAPRIDGFSAPRAEALVAQAVRHGVGPMLRRRLIGLGLFRKLPASAREALDRHYAGNAARALARARDLGAILERLEASGVEVIALKGVYLAQAVYPAPALRPMIDMDLLCRERDLETAQAALLGLGYIRNDSDLSVAECLANRHQLPPFLRPGATTVEIHGRIERPNAPFAIDHEGLWRRSRPWRVEGKPLRALAPEDLLLHLCLHATYHHRFRIGLSALMDIARVTRLEPVDWQAFVVRARAWKASLPAFLGLFLTGRLLGVEPPASVLSALAPAESAEALLAVAEGTLLAERREDRGADALTAERRAMHGYLRMVEGARALPDRREKLGFLFAKAFPPRAVLEGQYPRFQGSGWVRVMYGAHWLVVAGRFARAMGVNWGYWRALRKLDRQWL